MEWKSEEEGEDWSDDKDDEYTEDFAIDTSDALFVDEGRATLRSRALKMIRNNIRSSHTKTIK